VILDGITEFVMFAAVVCYTRQLHITGNAIWKKTVILSALFMPQGVVIAISITGLHYLKRTIRLPTHQSYGIYVFIQCVAPCIIHFIFVIRILIGGFKKWCSVLIERKQRKQRNRWNANELKSDQSVNESTVELTKVGT
jgi:hypothetical protein